MAFHVRDPEADTMVRRFAEARGVGLTDAIKLAVSEAEAAREAEIERRMEAMRAIADRIALLPDTGLVAEKAFMDELSGQ
jgi:antitoxin VapB